MTEIVENTEVELTDEELDEYFDIAFAMGNTTGFSKGTANVSARDLKKLKPLVRFYAKKAKPFTACVNDNRKRFGTLTEKYCAIIKDLIVGNTKWRNQSKRKSLSEGTLFELFALDVPHDFLTFLSELDEEEIEAMMTDEAKDESTELAQDDYKDRFMAEMFLSTEDSVVKADAEGHIWKPIMRSGIWKFSPSKEGAAPKTLTITKDGVSDRKNLTISMSELKKNFEEGAVEHVTIPASHADTVLENTGFIRKLRFAKDEEGRDVLEAAMDFTEPDVKEKAERGTIANTSAGVLFDYIHKEKGTKFRSVLAHAALTNRPWLNGMKPFGVNASDDLEVIGFSEEIENRLIPDGGEGMTEVAYDFSALGFASEDELKLALSEAKDLKAKSRERDVADLCKKWQDDGKTPALVAEAQTIMMSDDGAAVLNLSEDGKDVGLSASDIVKRLVEKSSSVKLDEDVVTDKDVTGDKPKEEEEKSDLSDEERLLASQLYFDGGYSMKDAEAEAKKRLASASAKS